MGNDLLIGRGMVFIDVTLALLATVAALMQYWRIACWTSTTPVWVGRWMMALGWTTLAGRVWQQLWTVGDILISLPSLISLILLAAGAILIAVFWRSGADRSW